MSLQSRVALLTPVVVLDALMADGHINEHNYNALLWAQGETPAHTQDMPELPLLNGLARRAKGRRKAAPKLTGHPLDGE